MRIITECRSCGSDKLTEFLDLGIQYTSDFREDNKRPPAHPIVAVLCDACFLVQLRHTTPSKEMYHENYGFKSGVSDSIKDDLRENVEQCLDRKIDAKTWLDIASNDGTLLSYVPENIYRVGIDPIAKYCEMAREHADGIINDFFDYERYFSTDMRKFDIITSISCFYDMDDPNKFVADASKALAEYGIWDIQQNYLLPTLQLNAVDNMCHEHLEYYTLLSLEPLLERHGLEVFDVQTNTVNGGSLRTFVCHKGAYPIQDSVEKQRTEELDFGLNTKEPYFKFAEDCWKGLRELKLFVADQVKEGKKVAILAASTRGSTIWQAAGLTNKEICFAIERNPEKVGKMFSAIGVPIVSEEYARKIDPDVMIIGPWFFREEIINREAEYLENGGLLCVPLPRFELVRK